MNQLITLDGEVLLFDTYNAKMPNFTIFGPVQFQGGKLDTIFVDPDDMSYVNIDQPGSGLYDLETTDVLLTGDIQFYYSGSDLIPFKLTITAGPGHIKGTYPITVMLTNPNSVSLDASKVTFSWMKTIKLGPSQIPLFAIGFGVNATKCLVFNNTLAGPTFAIVDLTTALQQAGVNGELGIAIPNATVDLTKMAVEGLKTDITRLNRTIDQLEIQTANIEEIVDSVKARYVNR